MVAEDGIEDNGDDDAGCLKQGCGLVAGVILLGIGYALLSNFPSVLYCVGLLIGGSVVGIGAHAYLEPSSQTAQRLKGAGIVTLSLGGVALLSSLLLMMPFGGTGGIEDLGVKKVPSMGGTVGPITVEEDIWADVRVRQQIEPGDRRTYERWSFVTVNLLDGDKEYLSSFGGGFWNYAGYDDGYRWTEDDEGYSTTLQIPAGTYYVRLETEANVNESDLGPVLLQIDPAQWWGNPVPLQWLAYIACFFGAALLLTGITRFASDETTVRDDVEVDVEDDFEFEDEE